MTALSFIRNLFRPAKHRHPLIRYADALSAHRAALESNNPHLIRKAVRLVNKTRRAALRGGA